MQPKIDQPGSVDTGLAVFLMLLRFHGIGADAEQIRHRFAKGAVGVPEILRCPKELGLKARSVRGEWRRLAVTPLPAIAMQRDGKFFILAKAAEDKVLIQQPFAPARLMARAELEAMWSGQLVLMARRASLSDLSRRFDISWFIGAIAKYKGILGEVLVASFFLQVFALISPLFFQVVIDKVLVHRGMSTLEVLILGLVEIGSA